MNDPFPRPGALLYDENAPYGDGAWGILSKHEGTTLIVFWSHGRRGEIYRWQLEERLIRIVVP